MNDYDLTGAVFLALAIVLAIGALIGVVVASLVWWLA